MVPEEGSGEIHSEAFTTNYKGEEYYVLQSYQESSEPKKEDYRRVWIQIRSYFYEKEKAGAAEVVSEENFDGRWMPEGTGEMYRNCLGEYPWSPDMVNYLGEEEEQWLPSGETGTVLSDHNRK